ncbi:MAG: hypothetical protein GY696_18750, partial [Gammaproteobacteria bacterium]|nr:hypothetical protein [Gammaproteobacteria bacterium]
SNAAFAEPDRPFPQHTPYASGTITPNHFTQGEKDQHVRNFYDSWKSNYLVAAGTDNQGFPLYRVALARNSPVTVSEGQGYGMVITALMAGHDTFAQQYFDGLWRFSRAYPSGYDYRLMSWYIINGVIDEGNTSAFDGDADIAYGLLLAHEQWGSEGDINYFNEAIEVIDAMMVSTIGPDSMLPTLGDWVGYNDIKHNQYTPRSSDFMPSHFHAFAIASQNNDWNVVIEKSQDVIDSIQSNYSSVTGLLPDFIMNCQIVTNCEPAYEGFLEEFDGDYYYNAGRVPLRIGMDVLLNDNQRSRNQLQKINTWLSATMQGDPDKIMSGYKLDGTPLFFYSSTFFIAPFAVALMSDTSQQVFLNTLYTHIYNLQDSYFEDSINLLSLIVLSGNYWQPGMGNSTLTACSDGIDNDGDGLIDLNDPGC